MPAREEWRQVSVFGEREGHAGGGEDGAVKQRDVGDHGRDRHQIAEPGATDEQSGGGEVSVFPLLPVAERGQGGEGREEIRCYGKWNDQRSRIAALRVLDFLGHGGELLVSGVEPQAESEAHSEYFGESLVRRHQRDKGIVMPLGEAEDDHGDHGNENEDFENRGGFAYHLNAANVDPGDEGDQDERNQPVFPSDDLRKIKSQVVGEEHSVGSA